MTSLSDTVAIFSGTVAIFMTPNRARFILMKVVQQGGTIEFQNIPGFNVSEYTVKAIDLGTSGALLGTFPVKTFDGKVMRKQIRKYDTCLVVNTVKNERVDVIRFSDPSMIIGAALYAIPFLQSQLPKPVYNMYGKIVSPPPIPIEYLIPPPSAPPSLPPPPSNDISGNTVQHVSPLPSTAPSAPSAPKKKKISHNPTPASLLPPIVTAKASKSDMNLFVAKQLLELAQLKKEMCPIIAEEFSAGHTAAMPCGHLFSQTAIEESFKKERNKCPACRQMGSPTYV